MAKLTGKSKEMADEIQAVLMKYGYKTTRYFVSTDVASARLTINVIDTNSSETPYAVEYKRSHSCEGFKLEWLGLTFNYGGKPTKLEGFKPGGRVCKVIISNGGKNWIASPEQVKRAIQHHLYA